jgi:alkylation response protein AidB-like acyl-CoA dehydrogenase
MRTAEEALAEAKRFLREEVSPRAQEMDQDVEALRRAVDGLCQRELMALKRPEEFGGPDMAEPLFREYQEEIARYSGALAFLTTQHQSAVSMIGRGENPGLAAEYLPYMADGRKLVGIGFSQLRRAGPPMMCAEPVAGGFLMNGTVPWITGAGFFPEFLIGAALPDGQSVFGVVPLVDIPGEVKVSSPMRLAAMETANTVSAEFSGHFMPESKVTFFRPPNWIRNNDQINIALQGHFALGCAQAGIDIVRLAASKRGIGFLEGAAEALESELADCKAATAEAQLSVDEETTDERLGVRAWAIELAVRCAHAGITASSGAANSLTHPAQRVYREALVYTVSAQTTPVMEATLRRITRT